MLQLPCGISGNGCPLKAAVRQQNCYFEAENGAGAAIIAPRIMAVTLKKDLTLD